MKAPIHSFRVDKALWFMRERRTKSWMSPAAELGVTAEGTGALSRQEALRAGSREQCWLPTEAEAGAWQVWSSTSGPQPWGPALVLTWLVQSQKQYVALLSIMSPSCKAALDQWLCRAGLLGSGWTVIGVWKCEVRSPLRLACFVGVWFVLPSNQRSSVALTYTKCFNCCLLTVGMFRRWSSAHHVALLLQRSLLTPFLWLCIS